MAAMEPAVSCVSFSTRDRPERERLPFWCEHFGRHVIRTHIEVNSDAHFEAKGALLSAPGLRVHWSSYSSSARIARPRELISADDDNIALLIDRGGTAAFAQGGHEVALEPGGGVTVLHAEPALMTFPRVSYMAVMAPLKALRPFTRSVENSAGRRIQSNTEALRLLAHYVDMLKRRPLLSDRRLIELVVAQIHDLMALALGATPEGAALARGRGLRAARLEAVKLHIRQNLAMHELSPRSVAAHFGLSTRYIHMLFDGEDTTFSTFVREQRLLAARAMLRSPRFAGHSISSIAFAAGFGDVSYFNRVFRTRFGASPTEIRFGR